MTRRVVVGVIGLLWLLFSIRDLRDYARGRQKVQYSYADRRKRPIAFSTFAVINLTSIVTGLGLIGYIILLKYSR